MSFPKINLHIHSVFSDGKNPIKKIVKKSLKLGLNHIAITDHFTNSWKAGVINTLNSEEKINQYLEEISICQAHLKTFNKDLWIYKGLEIDLESSEKYIKKLIRINKFDLILFEYLESLEGIAFIKNLINYWNQTISIEKDLPIFGLAHFDPSNFIYGGLDTLITFLKEYDIYYEFNSGYSQFYSRKYELFFEQLRKIQVPVAIGCDSHHSRRLSDIEEPLEMIKYYSLQENYLNFLELLKFKQ